jgi:hypothetical protein
MLGMMHGQPCPFHCSSGCTTALQILKADKNITNITQMLTRSAYHAASRHSHAASAALLTPAPSRQAIPQLLRKGVKLHA